MKNFLSGMFLLCAAMFSAFAPIQEKDLEPPYFFPSPVLCESQTRYWTDCLMGGQYCIKTECFPNNN